MPGVRTVILAEADAGLAATLARPRGAERELFVASGGAAVRLLLLALGMVALGWPQSPAGPRPARTLPLERR